MKPRLALGVTALALSVAGGFMVYGNGMAIVRMWQSSDWVRVRAEAINPTTYRYTIANATFTSKVLAPDHVYDTPHEDLGALAEALAERYRTKQPFTVFVNPAAPAEAMLSREFEPGEAGVWAAIGILLCLVGPFLGYLALKPGEAKAAPPQAKPKGRAKRGGKQAV